MARRGCLPVEGYWRLQASAVGYHAATSRVYHVPPEVAGIRLNLRPDPWRSNVF